MNNEFFEYQQKRIERDIASFSDPGRKVEVTGQYRRFRATWTVRGHLEEAVFSVSLDHGINVAANGQHQSYSAFLASDRMADLRNVAEMIRGTANPGSYVETKASLSGRSNCEPKPAVKYLVDLLEKEGTSTQVIMVTGEAGAGKTQVLRRLVQQQADMYVRGKTEKLCLYVNAQGRALARLDEAFATELQDLKAKLTYHSIATLARVGILIPVIDGFDELLGVSGYEDPFNSLAKFLEQLEGEGSLVASARSLYYQQEFLSRADRASMNGAQSWEYLPVTVFDWTEVEKNEFITDLARPHNLSKEKISELKNRIMKAFGRYMELSEKPLFFARVSEIVWKADDGQRVLSDNEELVGALALAYLERERREKLLDRQQKPLLSTGQLKELMAELAQEMWNQETRELDSASVREVADYILGVEELPEPVRQIVVQRMSSLTFLSRGGMQESIMFEHEVFFFFFLAHSIVRQFQENADLRVVLSRSVLPYLVAEQIVDGLRKQGVLGSSPAMQEVLDRLADAGRTEWRRTTQVRENAGLVVLALIRAYALKPTAKEVKGLVIRSVVFPGGNLRNVSLRCCSFFDVSFRRTDISNTKFLECQGRNVRFLVPTVKEGGDGTWLDIEGLSAAQVEGVRVLRDERDDTIYSPRKVAAVLEGCGIKEETEAKAYDRDIPEQVLVLLDRLIRAYERANPVCVADSNLKNIFNDTCWQHVEKLLLDNDLVREEQRSTSGSPKKFLRRRFLPQDLMAGIRKSNDVAPEIARFWEALEAIYQ